MTSFSRRRCLSSTAAYGAVAMGWGLLGIAGCDGKSAGSKASFNATDITGATYAQSLSLPDPDGRMRSLEEFRGKVVFVFFGYTQCPDVCPTTMAELAEIRRNLGSDGEKVQGIFVSIDPERDTPDILKAYAQSLDPTLVALRGSADQLAAAARSFKIFYQKVPGRTEGSYTMDHTAGAYVFDPAGRVRLFVRYGTPIAALTADLKQLIQGA